jgi:hypothetical protein
MQYQALNKKKQYGNMSWRGGGYDTGTSSSNRKEKKATMLVLRYIMLKGSATGLRMRIVRCERAFGAKALLTEVARLLR